MSEEGHRNSRVRPPLAASTAPTFKFGKMFKAIVKDSAKKRG